MRSYIHEILVKMKKPEYPKFNFDLAFRLTNESERGAVLISFNKIEEFLERLIDKLLPSKTKNYKAKLLKYPGALSSFSGKIELLYAFRIIDKSLYETLNSLRVIRNKIAHSSELFTLQDVSEQLEQIYNFENNLHEVIQRLALENLLKYKKIVIENNLKEENLLNDNDDIDDMINESLKESEMRESFNKQLGIWKLAFGITLLCLKIEAIIDDYEFINLSNKTWLDFEIEKGKTV